MDPASQNNENVVYAGTCSLEQQIEGSPMAVIKYPFKRSNVPYVIQAWPENKSFKESGVCFCIQAQTPDFYCRELMFAKNNGLGNMMFSAEQERKNEEYNKLRNANMTISARMGSSLSEPVWENAPSVIIVDQHQGKNVTRKLNFTNGELNAKVFSGKVAVLREKDGTAFKVNPGYTLNINQGENGSIIIFPTTAKVATQKIPLKKIKGVVKCYGQPGTTLTFRLPAFGGEAENTGTGTISILASGILELPVYSEKPQQGIIIQAWVGEKRLPEKKIYSVGRNQVVYLLSDPAAKTTVRDWTVLNGDPMVPGGFSTNGSFRSFVGSGLYWKSMKDVLGDSRLSKSILERYTNSFGNPQFVQMDKGTVFWKLGFGRNCETLWSQRVRANWDNARFVTLVSPDESERGYVPVFVAGSNIGPGCGNIALVWRPEFPEPRFPTQDYPEPPEIVPEEVPVVGLGWLYVGNTGAGMRYAVNNPTAAPTWVPAAPITIENGNNIANWQNQGQNQYQNQNQDQVSNNYNNNNNWNYNTNTNTWTLNNNIINQLMQILNNSTAVSQ